MSIGISTYKRPKVVIHQLSPLFYKPPQNMSEDIADSMFYRRGG